MDKEVIHIATAINESYLPYFSVMVSSLFRHRNPKRYYHVYVLASTLSAVKISQAAPFSSKSFTVELIDVSGFKKKLSSYNFGSFFGPESLYRLDLQELLPKSNKIIYLDSDLVVLKDIGELYDIDLEGFSLAATRDIGTAGMVSGYKTTESERLARLNITNGLDYFNAGVLILNLKEMRKKHCSTKEYIDWIFQNQPEYLDQDCLNYFFKDSVKYLPMEWNALFDSEGIRVKQIASQAPSSMYEDYLRARQNPYIFHFAGPIKPWMENVDGSSFFWNEARQSPLYENVLACYIERRFEKMNDGLMEPVWKTFDDLYFKVNEGERIRADLHRRLSNAEENINELNGTIIKLQAEIDELLKLKTPIVNRLYARIKK